MTTASPAPRPFERLLVANRGEIAVRVMRTAKAMGLHTIAVHSTVDADAVHVRVADEAVLLGPAPATASYLDVERLLAAARQSGADAVHPGYGFLSEDAAFARACEDAGLVFVGPSAAAIGVMGDKAVAKHRMAAAAVPLVPGYDGDDQSDERLTVEADRIGWPVMVKAAAGGGGKGMRRVSDPRALPAALAAARREARGAFGSDHLILERALDDARHVEVQVLADHHGTVLALGERDCSVQRRHQKVVEEAPCPVLDAATRTAMAEAAVAAARAIGYVGAGTVEFLLASGHDRERTPPFAFLEMNTRLQVEHPVTELVTGLDLVEWQLRVAAGEALPWSTTPPVDGHAIEARLYAEDPADQFLPQAGTVLRWDAPVGPGVRVDAGITAGSEVTAHYDPLVAKVIAHGRDRGEARRRLAAALADTVVHGVTTNRTFLMAVLADPTFVAGEATTTFLDDHPVAAPGPTHADLAAVAAWLHWAREADAASRSPGRAGWSSRGHARSRQRLRVRDEVWEVDLDRHRDGLEVQVRGPSSDPARTFHASAPPVTPLDAATAVEREPRVVLDGHRVPLVVSRPTPDRVLAHLPHVDIDARDVLHAPPVAAGATGAGVVVAPMHGTVTTAAVAVGDTVEAGDELVTLEAMKMEHVLRADVAGTVVAVAAAGTQVATDDVLARVDPEGGA